MKAGAIAAYLNSLDPNMEVPVSICIIRPPRDEKSYGSRYESWDIPDLRDAEGKTLARVEVRFDAGAY